VATHKVISSKKKACDQTHIWEGTSPDFDARGGAKKECFRGGRSVEEKSRPPWIGRGSFNPSARNLVEKSRTTRRVGVQMASESRNLLTFESSRNEKQQITGVEIDNLERRTN